VSVQDIVWRCQYGAPAFRWATVEVQVEDDSRRTQIGEIVDSQCIRLDCGRRIYVVELTPIPTRKMIAAPQYNQSSGMPRRHKMSLWSRTVTHFGDWETGQEPRLALPQIEGAFPSDRMRAVPKELLAPARASNLIFLAAVDWLIIAAIWLTAPHLPAQLYPLWVLLLAGRLHALGVVLHDAVHMPPGRKTSELRLLEILAGYPIGSTIDAMRYHHLRHHRENGLPEDPYFKPWIGNSRVRFWLMTPRYFLLLPLWVLRGIYGSLATYLPILRNGYGHWFLQDRYEGDLTGSAEVLRCAREDRWQLLFHICVLALAMIYPRWVLTFYVVPGVMAGYLAGYRLQVEHRQEPNHDRSFLTTIHSTRDHNLGLAGRVLLVPHNAGYHLVHHLHPQVALENLPKLRDWYIENCEDIYRS
jgi:fatty acid desaturase